MLSKVRRTQRVLIAKRSFPEMRTEAIFIFLGMIGMNLANIALLPRIQSPERVPRLHMTVGEPSLTKINASFLAKK